MEERRDPFWIIILVFALGIGTLSYQVNQLYKAYKEQVVLLNAYKAEVQYYSRKIDVDAMKNAESFSAIVDYLQAVENAGIKKAEYEHSLKIKKQVK